MSAEPAGVRIVRHPLVQHHLALLRDRTTEPESFRRALAIIATLMVYEATGHLATRPVRVQTPLARAQGRQLRHPLLLVPILRAGLGMLPSILQLIPDARVGLIGLKRDELSLAAHTYHDSLPNNLREHEVVLMDPMLATGGSALAALDLLSQKRPKHLGLVNIVAAPEGVRAVRQRYPNVPMHTAALDRKLNGQGYILPGLGDAGDRLFGV